MKLKIAIILSLFLPWLVVAQCPYGEGNRVDCQYGCGNYVDNNHDNYCDHSSLSATKEEKVIDTICESAEDDIETTTEDIELVDETDVVDYSESTSEPTHAKRYHFWLITLITLGLYLLTFILVKTKVLQKVYQRRIWNAILLVAALVSCIFGLILTINVNYMFLGPQAYKFLITWHVEAGIVMTIICIFHIIWHLKYYKNLFAKVKKSNSAD